jgi:hypothetical protein
LESVILNRPGVVSGFNVGLRDLFLDANVESISRLIQLQSGNRISPLADHP